VTPTELKAIRQRYGLTQGQLAAILRIEDQRTVRRWEAGDRAISGPATILLELMHTGELPSRYWNPQPNE
jgi:DNA-binding transcriptional regulator YiaG